MSPDAPAARVPGRDLQILQAAAELFHERGFHQVGVVDIGGRIGISGPAIYRHFSSKDEILATLFHQAMDELTAPSDRDEDPRAELELLIRRHVTFALERRELLAIFTHEERSLAEPLRQRFRRRMRTHAQRWESVLARCYPEAHPRAVAAAAQGSIGLIHSVAFWPQAARRTPHLEDVVVGLVLGGVNSLRT